MLNIVEQQEDRLVFEHFDNKDAWDIGNQIVQEAKKRELNPAISIRLNNGFIVFQYGFNNTGLDHENWMKRKENTAKTKGFSSLKADLILKTSGLDLEKDWFMDPMEYSTCGGAFPIRVKGVGIIGFIIVSGISYLMDHELIIEGLRSYFNMNDLPKVTD